MNAIGLNSISKWLLSKTQTTNLSLDNKSAKNTLWQTVTNITRKETMGKLRAHTGLGPRTKTTILYVWGVEVPSDPKDSGYKSDSFFYAYKKFHCGTKTYMKQASIQSSLFWSTVKRSTTFTPISRPSFTRASEHLWQNSFFLTSSLKNRPV